MFIATLFIIDKEWKELKWPPADEWVNKMWSIHMLENYSIMKRNGVLVYIAPWMNLRNIVLSGISQSQKIADWDSPGGPVVKNPPARRQGFNPQSGKSPHAVEQLSPCASTTEARKP